ncbi:MAG: TIGR03936 family radical SAM-associated protein [Synergistaceae bacterium]|nr:TIGR03936 family radical SAM-associated protein [Synergistaceae bacterium]
MPRVRIIFEKTDWFVFVNHMDLPTVFSRAAKRAGLAQEFTQGFSPHPHISLAAPLAIGLDGYAEPADFWFVTWDNSSESAWNSYLPRGLKILRSSEVDTDGPALGKVANAAAYEIVGLMSALDKEGLDILKDEVTKSGVLFDASISDGRISLSVGGLEHCGAGNFVRALKTAGKCDGWSDLQMTRLLVGRWEPQVGKVVPLI